MGRRGTAKPVNSSTGTLFTSTWGKRPQRKERGDKDETVREVEREVKWRDVKLDESSARDNKSATEIVPPNYSDARSQLSWDRLMGGSFPPGEGEDVSPAPRQIAPPPHSIAGDNQHYPQVLFNFIVPSHTPATSLTIRIWSAKTQGAKTSGG